MIQKREIFNLKRKTIKICRIVTVPLTLDTLLRKQLEFLVAAGIDLTVVSSGNPDPPEYRDLPNYRHVSISMERSPNPFEDIKSLIHLQRFYHKNNFDIVHSSTPKAGLLSAIAAYLGGVPVRIHTFTGQVWVEKRGVSRWLLKGCDKIIGHLNTHCYADSHSQKKFLVQNGMIKHQDLTVHGNGSIAGINLKRFSNDRYSQINKDNIRYQTGISEKSIIILMVGRLTRDKGIVELVSAFKKVSSQYDNIELLLVGPYEPERDPIPSETITEIENNPLIHSVGYSGEPEKYMAIADIFCLPSYREGFGNVVIEAASFGVPAIGTDIVGLRDAITDGDTGMLVQKKSSEKLAEALETMIVDNARRMKMGEHARQRAITQFNSDYINDLVLNEYYRLRRNVDAEA